VVAASASATAWPCTLAAMAGGLVLISFKLLSTTEPAPRVVAWHAIMSVLFWGPVSAFFWQTPSLFAVLMIVVGDAVRAGQRSGRLRRRVAV
jgi:uncharacterized YccA/Bax inhibitor family protein